MTKFAPIRPHEWLASALALTSPKGKPGARLGTLGRFRTMAEAKAACESEHMLHDWHDAVLVAWDDHLIDGTPAWARGRLVVHGQMLSFEERKRSPFPTIFYVESMQSD